MTKNGIREEQMAISGHGILQFIHDGEFSEVVYLLNEKVIAKPNDCVVLVHGIVSNAKDKYDAFLSWLDCNKEYGYLAEWFRAPLPAR